MIEVNGCTYDGKEYVEVDRIVNNGKTYAFLVNEKDEYDFMIRVVNTENGEEIYDPLKDDKEFELLVMLFVKKNANLLKDIKA